MNRLLIGLSACALFAIPSISASAPPPDPAQAVPVYHWKWALAINADGAYLRDAADDESNSVSCLKPLNGKVVELAKQNYDDQAIEAVLPLVGQTGWSAVTQLLTLMLGFYLTCILFVFGVLGVLSILPVTLCWWLARPLHRASIAA